jgi:hypothetical protein
MTIRLISCSLVLFLSCGHLLSASDRGERVLRFPEPPDPRAIATEVGSIRTYIRQVTVSRPVPVYRYGLFYFEIRGVIEGVGWGGQNSANVRLQQHYTYRLPYVLRVPPGWKGTVVVHRHGTAAIALWQSLEATLGERSFGRRFHETADRFVSDVAMDPRRGWAFFAVNQTPVDPGGAFNTHLLGDSGNPADLGAPVHSMFDVPIGRDTAVLAKRLLRVITGRTPDLTLGTGHSGGALANFMLNAGVDHMRTGAAPVATGDNHVRPYDPSSGRIFDGFISFARGSGLPPVPIDPVRGVSAPTLFVEGDVDTSALQTIRQLDEIVAKGLDTAGVARLYMVRNMPHIDADLVSILSARGRDFAGLLGLPDAFYAGGGDRLKPLSAALLDALEDWAKHGIAPPTSIYNGTARDTDAVAGVDTLEFTRSDGSITRAFPYVDDAALDTIVAPAPTSTQQNPSFAAAWQRVRSALDARTESIVLPETACRRGSFSFVAAGPVGAWFRAFDEPSFLQAWGSSSAHQTCRVGVADSLTTEQLYDATVVSIDVLPQQFPNVVDLASRGRLNVAILSTAGFDAGRILPATLRLAGASMQGLADGPNHVDAQYHDINGDGRVDMVVEFRLDTLRFSAHDTVAELWGVTKDRKAFTGSDVVELVR